MEAKPSHECPKEIVDFNTQCYEPPKPVKRLTRRFLGNINGKTPLEKKELKAYIKGKEYFTYGRYSDGSPRSFKVRQSYFFE